MARLFSHALNLAYLALLVVASPLILWSAVRHGKHREGFGAKLLGLVPRRDDDRPCVWLHAVSVGEVNLLSTTIAELAARRPECEIVISTTTKTGYDLAVKRVSDALQPVLAKDAGLKAFYETLKAAAATAN